MKKIGGNLSARFEVAAVLWPLHGRHARARRTGKSQMILRLVRLLTRGRRYLHESYRSSVRGIAVFVSVGLATALALRHLQITTTSGLGISVETTEVALALACAVVAMLRFSGDRRARDLSMFAAALSLATMSLALTVLPDLLRVSRLESLGAGAASDLLFAALFAAAAFVPPDRLMTGSRFWLGTAVLGAFLLAGGAELLGLLLRVGARVRAVDGAAHLGPLMITAISVSALLQTVAGVGFARWSRRPGGTGSDALVLAACAFGAASISRSSGHTWAAVVPLATLASAAMMYATVSGELRARKREYASHAVAERRRVARDLHDGLAQDLAFIVANSAALDRAMGAGHPLGLAARRALAVSRCAIAELSAPSCADTRQFLETLGHELQDRFGISVSVEVDTERDFDDHARDHVSRIVREAVANAVRHGEARHVLVCLSPHPGGVSLRVWDDGRAGGRGGRQPYIDGFGMRSMRERTTSLGGSFSVVRPRTGGTRVECLLP